MHGAMTTAALALAVALSAAPAAFADPDEDESGHGRWHGREYKEECRDGDCKIERKWERDGGYKEEIKCKGRHRPPVAYHGRPTVYVETGPDSVLVPRGSSVLACNRDLVGSLLGGAAGGVLGSRIGKGEGRLAATAAGALVGVLIGGEIGRSMDRLDQVCAGQALEHLQVDEVATWQNANGVAYELKPIETYRDRSGRPCREFISTVTIDGRPQQGYATACREPDGSWRIAG